MKCVMIATMCFLVGWGIGWVIGVEKTARIYRAILHHNQYGDR